MKTPTKIIILSVALIFSGAVAQYIIVGFSGLVVITAVVILVIFAIFVTEYIVGKYSQCSLTNVELSGSRDKFRQISENQAKEINKNEVTYKAIHECVGDGLVVIDGHGKILTINISALQMLGLARSDVVGEDVGSVIVAERKNREAISRYQHPVNQVLERMEKLTTHDFFLIHKDKSRIPVSFTTTPIILEGNIIGAVSVFRDITRDIQEDNAKTEFVSIASHQLRTPLTAIRLFVEMIAHEDVGKLNDKQKEYMKDVSDSTDRMIRLVNDLLNVSRLETGRLRVEPKMTHLEHFIESVIAEAVPLCRINDCQLKFEKADEEVGEVMFDPDLMHQVVHNLITNAIRYSNDGGEVLVKVEQSEREYIITVKDNGIGIPQPAQSRIFEKFYRADNAMKKIGEGSGLGLYVVKMIVETFGGRIWFVSEEGKGTAFYVTIPKSGVKRKEGERGIAL